MSSESCILHSSPQSTSVYKIISTQWILRTWRAFFFSLLLFFSLLKVEVTLRVWKSFTVSWTQSPLAFTFTFVYSYTSAPHTAPTSSKQVHFNSTCASNLNVKWIVFIHCDSSRNSCFLSSLPPLLQREKHFQFQIIRDHFRFVLALQADPLPAASTLLRATVTCVMLPCSMWIFEIFFSPLSPFFLHKPSDISFGWRESRSSLCIQC